MVDYRLFFMNGHRRFQNALVIVAADDEGAISLAATEPRSGAMELWCGPRLVRAWACADLERSGPGSPDNPL